MKSKQLLLSLLLLGVLLPRQMFADDFMQTKSNYKAQVMGIDKIQFSLPTQYDGSGNEGITNGKVYVQVDGGSKQLLIDWYCKDYSQLYDNGYESGYTYVIGYQDGSYRLLGNVIGGQKSFNPNTKVEYRLKRDDDNKDHFTSVFEWTVPRSMRGHNLNFYVWAKIESATNHWYIEGDSDWEPVFLTEWNCPPAPVVSINASEPMLSFDKDHVNQQMFTYSVQAKSIKWIQLHYTDSLSGNTYSKELDKSKMADLAYVPANVPLKDIYIEAKLLDAEGREVEGTVKSGTLSTKMLHYPAGLSTLGGGLCVAASCRQSGVQSKHRDSETEPSGTHHPGQCQALRPARHPDAASLTHRCKHRPDAACREEDTHLRGTTYRC